MFSTTWPLMCGLSICQLACACPLREITHKTLIKESIDWTDSCKVTDQMMEKHFKLRWLLVWLHQPDFGALLVGTLRHKSFVLNEAWIVTQTVMWACFASAQLSSLGADLHAGLLVRVDPCMRTAEVQLDVRGMDGQLPLYQYIQKFWIVFTSVIFPFTFCSL